MTRANSTAAPKPAGKSKGPAKGSKAWHDAKKAARADIDLADASNANGAVASETEDTEFIDE